MIEWRNRRTDPDARLPATSARGEPPPLHGSSDGLRGRAGLLGWLAGLVAYLSLMAGVLAPVWSSSVDPIWDGLEFNYPSLAFAADAIQAGHLPLWDPFTNCGQPFFAEPHLAWYQPAALLASLVSASHLEAYMLFWSGVWTWAGLGAFLLAAVLGARPLGSTVAAMSFALSGFFIGHAEHLPHLSTAAWFPWVLAFAHLSVKRANVGFAVLAGVALGLSALGGYPGLVIFEVLALSSWLVLAFLFPSSGPARDMRAPFLLRARQVGFVLGISIALLAVIWSPALYAFFGEGAGYTSQADPPSAEAALFGNTFSLRALLSLVVPRLVHQARSFFPADVSMNDAYVGALAVPLIGAYVASHLRRAWWLLAFVVLWFWMSLGGNGGLRNVVDFLVPVTRFMRYSAVLRVFALAGMAVGAGLGADWCVTSIASARSVRVTILGWLMVALAVLAVLPESIPGTFASPIELALPFVVACVGAVALLSWNGVTSRPAVVAVGLLAIVSADLAAHLRLDPATVWTEGRRARNAESLPKNADPATPRADLGVTRIHLVWRLPVVEGFVTLSSAFNSVLAAGRFRSVLSKHRYWLSPAAEAAPAERDGLPVLAKTGAEDEVPVFVSQAGGAQALPAGDFVVPGTYGSARIESYQDDRVELVASVPAGAGALLASTERYAPGWRAMVDGVSSPVARVNYFFRGVRLPPGVHRVIFTYEPAWFSALLAGSYLAVVLGTLAGAVLARRRGRVDPVP